MNLKSRLQSGMFQTIEPNRFWAAVTFVTILLGLGLSLVGAQPSGSAFLSIDPSPRSYALGGLNPAASLGAQGLYSNPAAISKTDRRYEFFSAYSSMLDGVSYGYGALAINRSLTSRGRVEGVGFSFTNLRVGGMDGRDRTGAKTGDSFGAQDSAYSLSLSYRLSGAIKMGLSGKLIQSEIAGVTSNSALAGDLGFSYISGDVRKSRTFGITLANIGQGVRFSNESDPLPASLNMGTSLGFGPMNVLATLNSRLHDQQTTLGLGFEVGMGPVSLRAGYRSDSGLGVKVKSSASGASDIASNFSTGMGIKLGSMKLDYALSQPSSELGMSHRMSLTWAWGKTAQDAKRPKI